MRLSHLQPLIIVLALGFSASACEDTPTAGPEEGTASLSVFLTDAPGDVEAVWVEVLEITAQGGEGGSEVLLDEPTDLILLTDLVGAFQLLSIVTELDPTTFRQLRLIIGDAVLVSTEGKVYVRGDPTLPEGLEEAELGVLHCPSCSQSGIKVKIPNDGLDVEEGSTALVLDFDVSQSYGHKAGESGKWAMHPVIHGTLVGDEDGDGQILDDLGLAGAISGTVSLGTDVTIPLCPDGTPRSLKDFIPTATLNGILDGEGQFIIRTGTTDAEGNFKIWFLPPGPFTLGYVESLNLVSDELVFSATVDPQQVVLSETEIVGVAYTIQSAECRSLP